MVPQRLREQGYQPFIDTLQHNMRGSGALRLDHVMGLMRLFWVHPRFGGAAQLLPAAQSAGALSWQAFVGHAARRWSELAERFELVRVPSLMELDSPELAAWQSRRAGRRAA